MKYLLSAFCLLLSVAAFADMPYHPIKYELTTDRPEYFEGDVIRFTLTLTNTDPKRSYIMMTPGGMNSGKKLVYLRVYDPASNLYVERAIEDRAILMSIKSIGIYGQEKLSPGAKLTISFSWNEPMDKFMSEVSAHHSFGKPLFAGRYMFQAFYDPSGTGTGEQLYHIMSHTDEEQSATKLNFIGAELSSPATVRIKPARTDRFKIEGVAYIRQELREGSAYYYYIGSERDSDRVCVVNSFLPDGTSRVEVHIKHNHNTLWLQHFDNGNIMKYSLTDHRRCPKEYYAREYRYDNEKWLVNKVDTLPGKKSLHIRYNEDGMPDVETLYDRNTYYMTVTSYRYKNGRLRKKQMKKILFEEPCRIVDVLLEADKR